MCDFSNTGNARSLAFVLIVFNGFTWWDNPVGSFKIFDLGNQSIYLQLKIQSFLFFLSFIASFISGFPLTLDL